MHDKIVQIQEEVKKAIVGKDDVIEKVLIAVLAQGHVLLEDVPGTGKTTLATAFAKALGLDNKRIQFTPDTMPSDIVGFSAYDMQTGELQYKPGAIMTNLLLADEINRTSSKTQSALLEAMEEKQVTVDGVTRKLEEPFICNREMPLSCQLKGTGDPTQIKEHPLTGVMKGRSSARRR